MHPFMNPVTRIGMAVLWITLAVPTGSFSQNTKAKKEVLKMDKPCPDFILHEVEDYPKKSVTLRDFRGKWLILDFWTSACMACISSMPRSNRLQMEFKDKVQYLLIAFTGELREGKSDYENIHALYHRIKKKEKLDLPIAFDSVLFKEFKIGACPFQIVIDAGGIIRGITIRLTADNMEDFLTGRRPALIKPFDSESYEKMTEAYDPLTPLLIKGNGGAETNYLYRSVFAKFDNTVPNLGGSFFNRQGNLAQYTGMSLAILYQAAYQDTIKPDLEFMEKPTGIKFWYTPILQMKDTSLFNADANTMTGYYNYSQVVPAQRATSEIMQKNMQRDLMNYFGYRVTVETRLMPCWNLIAKTGTGQKLKSNGSTFSMQGNFVDGFSLVNAPISKLVGALFVMHQLGPPFVDKTGITWNIDIKMDKGTYYWDDCLEALRKNGLDLVQDSILTKVVVINDQDDRKRN